ncbi:hypothetical protein LEP1GSC016_2222 [Leptospira borgpetersenii serovar Hardjo-bovis str. Sponselee]|uniref:Uncharacterized protein n=2 Tax=Leptospira borgpetersenii TaxID=174 RepID=M6BLR5_LEPBO|nr:hypothetical protein LEP1GSC016_2222 [Leptospira borgpetersenii serovar Hardjo-bovis str. Sponselee]EMO64823.1 hypothetical protein LEP1GSC133_2658 [Leptospira borgpetersenii serovar Pomona str. 200901868]
MIQTIFNGIISERLYFIMKYNFDRTINFLKEALIKDSKNLRF